MVSKMKLICNYCKSEIEGDGINISKGIAHCKACDNVFNIADEIRGEETLRRYPKPEDTSITITEHAQYTSVVFPENKPDSLTAFGVIASLVALTLLCLIENKEPNTTLMLVGLLIGGIVFTLVQTCLRLEIRMNKSHIVIIRSVLGIKYKSRMQLRHLKEVQNKARVSDSGHLYYGIAFVGFNIELTFGSNLTEEERNWLIGEFYTMRDEYLAKSV